MPNRKEFKTNKEYNAWFREYRKKNAVKHRKYQQEYNKNYRKKNGCGKNTWNKKNPEKIKIESLLNYAVLKGKIKKEPCQKCGKEKTHGHHPDYSEPLKVVWLCPLHHKEIHKLWKTQIA